LTLASAMLYPKRLAGAAVFSGWVPLDGAGFVSKITPEAKKVGPLVKGLFFTPCCLECYPQEDFRA
jgi:hypothetical protein